MRKNRTKKNGKIIVMKFGGTSLKDADHIKKVAMHIQKKVNEGFRPLVVVSAMDQTTDVLIKLAKSVADNPDPREMDGLLSTGEKQSAPLLAIALIRIGVKAKSMDAAQYGLIATKVYGNAKIKRLKNKKTLAKDLEDLVVVFTGFQGVVEGTNDLATLGRGGSDATAVALAAILGCPCIIYTDVDGVYTADPRIVPNAKRIDRISYTQIVHLADAGAAVVMGRAAEIAEASRVLVTVALSPSLGESTGGTVIGDFCDLNNIEGEKKGLLPSLAVKAIAGFKFTKVPNEPGRAKEIFEPLQEFNIDEDVQPYADDEDFATITILFDPAETDIAVAYQRIMLPNLQVIQFKDAVKITLVDPGVIKKKGVWYRVASSLARCEINILAKASAHAGCWVVVKEECMARATIAIAREFGLVEDEAYLLIRKGVIA